MVTKFNSTVPLRKMIDICAELSLIYVDHFRKRYKVCEQHNFKKYILHYHIGRIHLLYPTTCVNQLYICR